MHLLTLHLGFIKYTIWIIVFIVLRGSWKKFDILMFGMNTFLLHFYNHEHDSQLLLISCWKTITYSTVSDKSSFGWKVKGDPGVGMVDDKPWLTDPNVYDTYDPNLIIKGAKIKRISAGSHSLIWEWRQECSELSRCLTCPGVYDEKEEAQWKERRRSQLHFLRLSWKLWTKSRESGLRRSRWCTCHAVLLLYCRFTCYSECANSPVYTSAQQ